MAQTRTSQLVNRIWGVRRRKRAREGFTCEVLELKMEMVRTRGRKLHHRKRHGTYERVTE